MERERDRVEFSPTQIGQDIRPLSGIFFEQTATAMEAAAKDLGLPVEKAVAGTQLYIRGDPERPAEIVQEGRTWVRVRGRKPRDYTALWDKVKEMTNQVRLEIQ